MSLRLCASVTCCAMPLAHSVDLTRMPEVLEEIESNARPALQFALVFEHP
jgi:hypothetical protein